MIRNIAIKKKVISISKSEGRMKSMWIWIAMLIAVMATGCVSKPNDLTKNEMVTTSVATDAG